MHRLTILLIAALAATAACSGDRSILPTENRISLEVAPSAACVGGSAIEALLDDIFPAGPQLLNAARSQWSGIAKQCPKNLHAAQEKALDLIEFTLDKKGNGQLVPGVADAEVGEFINLLLAFVGFTPAPGLEEALESGGTGAVGIIGADGGSLITGDEHAALNVPPGALEGDRLFIILRQDALALSRTCLINTGLRQIPLCFNYSVFPADPFLLPVIVEICQLEGSENDPNFNAWRIARQRGLEPVEVLPAALPSLIGTPDCNDLPTEAQFFGGPIAAFFHRAARTASDLLLPPYLYAINAPRAGSTLEFSNFIAVDPESDVGVVTVTPDFVALQVGDQYQLTGEAFDVDGEPVDELLTWSSMNSSVATVNASGLVTAVATGDAAIRATASSGVPSGFGMVRIIPNADEPLLYGVESGTDGLSVLHPALNGPPTAWFIRRLHPDLNQVMTPVAMTNENYDVLWVWNNSPIGGLLTVDKCTGRAVVVNPSAGDQGVLGALAIDDEGTLYGLLSDLYTIDKTTGVRTLIGPIGYQIAGAEFGPDGVLYGVELSLGFERLITIDTETGAGTVIGTLNDGENNLDVGTVGSIEFAGNALIGSAFNYNGGQSILFDISLFDASVTGIRVVSGPGGAPQGMGFANGCVPPGPIIE